MADRSKDAEDRLLESMFASAPIADGGFSDRLVKKIRRKIWLQRSALPVAAIIGGLIAFKPIIGLAMIAHQLLLGMPHNLVESVTGNLPSLQLVVTGGVILLAAILSLNMLEE